MAAVNIVLADAQATPVNHTFVPIGLDANGVFWFEDQSQASPVGFWRISYQITRPPVNTAAKQAADRAYRVKIGLHEPILEVTTNSTVSGIAPAPTISYVDRVFTEYVLAERSSSQNRKDLRKMNYNLQNESQLILMVENLIGVTY